MKRTIMYLTLLGFTTASVFIVYALFDVKVENNIVFANELDANYTHLGTLKDRINIIENAIDNLQTADENQEETKLDVIEPELNEEEKDKEQKTFVATFNKNGADSISANQLKCNTKSNTCKITAPKITRSGYNILGWSTSIDDTTTLIKPGKSITLRQDTTFYAITSKIQSDNSRTFTATFYPGYASSIGAKKLTCTATSNSCTITAPSITRANANIKGWWAEGASANLIQPGDAIILESNKEYYTSIELLPYFIDTSSMLAMVNNKRIEAGVGNLSISSSISESAKIRAKELCTKYSHTRPDGSEWHTVSSLVYAENIAAGQSSVQSAFNSWFNSPGHKTNMLNGGYKTIGIAGYYCPGTAYSYYWVQLFGY